MPATPAQDLISASSCYTCLGMTQGEAMMLAEWDLISQSVSGVEGFNLLIQPGDFLLVQPGDRFVFQ